MILKLHFLQYVAEYNTDKHRSRRKKVLYVTRVESVIVTLESWATMLHFATLLHK